MSDDDEATDKVSAAGDSSALAPFPSPGIGGFFEGLKGVFQKFLTMFMVKAMRASGTETANDTPTARLISFLSTARLRSTYTSISRDKLSPMTSPQQSLLGIVAHSKSERWL